MKYWRSRNITSKLKHVLKMTTVKTCAGDAVHIIAHRQLLQSDTEKSVDKDC